MCRECFTNYADSCISQRKLVLEKETQRHTLGCPLGCANGLLNPEVATRTSLLRVLEIYPLEEEDDEDEQASS